MYEWCSCRAHTASDHRYQHHDRAQDHGIGTDREDANAADESPVPILQVVRSNKQVPQTVSKRIPGTKSEKKVMDRPG